MNAKLFLVAAIAAVTSCCDGPTPPLIPPQFTSVSAVDIGTDSVRVLASADQLVSIRVQYGETASYGVETVPVGPTMSLNQVLRNLRPSTTYHFRVVGENGNGVATSADQTFTTAVLPPTITSVSVVDISPDSVRVLASADQLVSIRVQYGETASYGVETAPVGPTMSLNQVLRNLRSFTTYHFRVVGENSNGVATSADQTFTTAALPPTITSVAFGNISPDSAQVLVRSDQDVMFWVEYWKISGSVSQTSEVGPTRETTFTLRNLSPVSNYRIRVRARNAQGLTASSAEQGFATPDYEPCDSRNTTAPRVNVEFSYRPVNPDFQHLLGIEIYDCAGNVAYQWSNLATSSDGGVSYHGPIPIRANMPSGSLPNRIRVGILHGGVVFLRWLEGGEFTLNGVSLTAHSDTLPAWPCLHPDSYCQPGVFWYFNIDATGRVTP